jgi:hypothetical protein
MALLATAIIGGMMAAFRKKAYPDFAILPIVGN